MAVALHAAVADLAFENVEGGEERRHAVAFVIVSHRADAALFHRQAGLSAVERLDLALLVHRQHDCMRQRIDIEPDDIGELFEDVRVLPRV